jgi:REP element-mobilizing transposase RayT
VTLWSDRPGLTTNGKLGSRLTTNEINLKMNFTPCNLYHVYNQGNNKQLIFSCDEDYLIFLRLVRKTISPHAEIIAYCLMPNHFHLLIYSDERVDKIVKQGGLLIDA